jgi:hypothetical protein
LIKYSLKIRFSWVPKQSLIEILIIDQASVFWN